jgi:hypothetical protein
MLPQAIGLIGDEQIEIVQAGVSARVTLTQVAALGGPTGPPGGGPTGPTGTFGPTGPAGPNTAVSINYTPPFTGGVTETVAAKLAQTVSVLDFGADPTGVADSTAAIQAAINAGNNAIFLPEGVYLISSITINNAVTLRGSGPTATVIKPKNSNSNIFDITTSDVIISGLAFEFGPTQTGGSYINWDVGSSLCTIENCYFLNWFIGIQVNGSGPFTIRDVVFGNGVPGSGTAVSVTGAVGGVMTLDNVVVTNPSGTSQQPANGLFINGGGNVNINCINCQFLQCIDGASLIPGAGQVIADAQFINCYFDHCITTGCLIAPSSSSGAVVRTIFDTCWFGSTSAGAGLNLSGSTGSIDGVALLNCSGVLNNQQGINISGANVKNVEITAGNYAGNSSAGIGIDALSTNGLLINGAHCGPWGSISGGTTFGIVIRSGTASNFTIANCDLRGNTSGSISDASTGTGRLKVNNKGYNPQPTVAISVTGSPFTYTAGDAPETVTISGGTVSAVTQNSLTMFTSTNCTVNLPSGTSVVVSYGSTPTMNTVPS